MADPLELSCEKLAVALLRQSSAVLAINPTNRIFVQSEDAGPDVDNSDRIVCKARPREVDSRGHRPDIVLTWRVFVEVSIFQCDLPAVQLQELIAAVTAAINTAPDAAALAIINASDITDLHDTDEGDFNTEADGRKRTKVFAFLADA